jgi:hypothetical protein
MEINELKSRLRQYYNDYCNCEEINLYCVCTDCKVAADKIDMLQSITDDMMNDHYVDMLDFYFNRCSELEDKIAQISKLVGGA